LELLGAKTDKTELISKIKMPRFTGASVKSGPWALLGLPERFPVASGNFLGASGNLLGSSLGAFGSQLGISKIFRRQNGADFKPKKCSFHRGQRQILTLGLFRVSWKLSSKTSLSPKGVAFTQKQAPKIK
jgi:hypothetical protein